MCYKFLAMHFIHNMLITNQLLLLMTVINYSTCTHTSSHPLYTALVCSLYTKFISIPYIHLADKLYLLTQNKTVKFRYDTCTIITNILFAKCLYKMNTYASIIVILTFNFKIQLLYIDHDLRTMYLNVLGISVKQYLSVIGHCGLDLYTS